MFQLKRAAATFWVTERAMAITALAGAAEALLLCLWIAIRGSPLVAPEGTAWVSWAAFWVARAFLDLEPGGAALGIATASALVGPLAGILLKTLAQLRLPERERAAVADR